MSGTAQYAVGIDLGTSNCALAEVSLETEPSQSVALEIRQALDAERQISQSTLPSFLYRAPSAEDWSCGAFARASTFHQPGRVIHSAKSWLCHPGVDRKARLLPWNSPDLPPAQRLSPLEASAQLLQHLKLAWEEEHALPLKNQKVAITQPASFDAVAQQLTLEAARMAGFPAGTHLLEEPQAAFYRWLESHGAEALPPIPEERPARLLVIDIGGGTSDFSLFDLEAGDPPLIRRSAVSDHILLGGDNLDRHLAHRFRGAFEEAGSSLSAGQWGWLLAESRRIKEQLLSHHPALPERLLLPAAGSSLFATQQEIPLDAEALKAEILEGFFPLTPLNENPERPKRGLRELGLPYAADSAVSKHLASFVRDQMPIDYVLLNGGSLVAPQLRERVLNLLRSWQDEPLELLDNPESDLAVARGAAAYLARRERKDQLIEAGAARSIYLEVRDPRSRAARPLCILPRGTAPGEVIRIDQHPLRVLVDTPARFQAYSSSRRSQDQAGKLLDLDSSDLQALPPLLTAMERPQGAKKPANQEVDVRIECESSDTGLLKIQLHNIDKRWKVDVAWDLNFSLRVEQEEEESLETPQLPKAQPEALARVKASLGKKGDEDPRSAKKLFTDLETILKQPRKLWEPALCRSLWPALAEGLTRRNRSKDHEAAWLMLAGFLLRPGFGDALDPVRINEVWRLQSLGLSFPKESRNQTQLWILWRRIAGGLDAERQAVLAKQWLGRLRQAGESPAELIRLGASMERAPAELKQDWIRAALGRLPKAPRGEASAWAWALGRWLGRIPFGGGPEDILPVEEVLYAWEQLRQDGVYDWSLPELPQALIRMTRLSDEPSLELPRERREEIHAFLLAQGHSEESVSCLLRYEPEAEQEHAALFGESLPPGIRLRG